MKSAATSLPSVSVCPAATPALAGHAGPNRELADRRLSDLLPVLFASVAARIAASLQRACRSRRASGDALQHSLPDRRQSRQRSDAAAGRSPNIVGLKDCSADRDQSHDPNTYSLHQDPGAGRGLAALTRCLAMTSIIPSSRGWRPCSLNRLFTITVHDLVCSHQHRSRTYGPAQFESHVRQRRNIANSPDGRHQIAVRPPSIWCIRPPKSLAEWKIMPARPRPGRRHCARVRLKD